MELPFQTESRDRRKSRLSLDPPRVPAARARRQAARRRHVAQAVCMGQGRRIRGNAPGPRLPGALGVPRDGDPRARRAGRGCFVRRRSRGGARREARTRDRQRHRQGLWGGARRPSRGAGARRGRGQRVCRNALLLRGRPDVRVARSRGVARAGRGV